MSRKGPPWQPRRAAKGKQQAENTNANNLTPANTEKLAVELAQKVDKELDADRNFFKRWPARQHYIRRIFPNERALLEVQAQAAGDQFPPATFDPSKHGIFVGGKKVFDRGRVRITFIATRDIETDLSEQEAHEVFCRAASEQIEQVVASLKAMGP